MAIGNILKLFTQFKHYKNMYACMNATTLENINLKWLDMMKFYHIKFNQLMCGSAQILNEFIMELSLFFIFKYCYEFIKS